MRGYFDNIGHPTVGLKVIGQRGTAIVPAQVDTGNDLALSLSTLTAEQLGLERVGSVPVEYANGDTQTESLYGATIEINGETIVIEIILTDSNTLLGAELLHGKKLTIDYAKKIVLIEKSRRDNHD